MVVLEVDARVVVLVGTTTEGVVDEAGAVVVDEIVTEEEVDEEATVFAVVEVDNDVAVVDEVTAVEDGEELSERYQFSLLVSPRHSAAVTPFHPRALIWSKKKLVRFVTDCPTISCWMAR